MNSQNSFKTIEYPQELDRRIAELEKELAPFLNTQNLSFALKEILASATGSVSKILGVTSCSNVDNIISYIDKYNEYVKLLKERNDFVSHTSSNIAHNYELRLNEKDKSILNLQNSELKARKERQELENEVKTLREEKISLKSERDIIAEGLKRAVIKIKSNILKYGEDLQEKSEDIVELNRLLREAKLLDKRIKNEKIENLQEQIRQFEPIKQGNLHFQKVIDELQKDKENLKGRVDNYTKLYIKLLDSVNKLGRITEIDLLEQENQDLLQINLRTINDNHELIGENEELRTEISTKDLEIQELKRQLAEQKRLNVSKDEQLARIDGIIELAKTNGNKTILLEEISDSIKPANNSLSVHPSHVARIYNEHDEHHKTVTTQASGLEKLIANQD
ncbi:MAG: hypothetical protein PHG82_05000 [Candidatus Gracilibacteria bacterium]|nr:hypothetical protein [Candidatus Gracilibacteria bacterium]